MTTISLIPPFKNSERGRQSSDFNRALKNIAIPWTLPLQAADQDIAVDGVTLSPLGQATITEVNPDVIGHWDNSAATGSKFVDQRANAIDAGAADTLLVPAAEEDEVDFWILGQLAPFFAVGLTNATVASVGVFAYEYLNKAGLWKAIPAGTFYDGTLNFQETTDKSYLVFQPPEDWAALKPADDQSGVLAEVEAALAQSTADPHYWIRGRVTTVFTIQPDIDVVEVVEMKASQVAEAFIAPATGVITHMTLDAVTAGGGNIDVVLMLVNHNRQTRGVFTFNAAASNHERVAATLPVFVDRGDELSLHVLQEDGTTEPQTITVIPEIEI